MAQDTQAGAGKTILITGGTGLIGRALCACLANQGYALLILTRTPDKAAISLGTPARFITSLDVIPSEASLHAIINLAGEPISQRWSARVKQSLVCSRVEATTALIDLMGRLHHKPAVFLSGSAIGVYGTSKRTVFSEEIPSSTEQAGRFSHQLCDAWEKVAMQAQQYGIRTCLLRTGVVLSASGGALKELLLPFRLGVGGPMGSGEQWFSWIHIDDMIRAIDFVLTHPVAGPVNMTAPHPVTNRMFARALGKTLRRPAVLPMPAWMVRLLFGEMGEALLLSGQRVVPAKLLDAGFSFRYQDLGSALSELLKS